MYLNTPNWIKELSKICSFGKPLISLFAKEINIIKKDGPVPNYLTLRGNGRTVELGSFLSEGERPIVANELRNAFSAAIGQAQRI